jgi:hypothetical protein
VYRCERGNFFAAPFQGGNIGYAAIKTSSGGFG